jgi:D-alanyl-D-alanine carboxypeptidase/D-alanyl-D-alanine-endopeptidase (penicillin-binding protein 4)
VLVHPAQLHSGEASAARHPRETARRKPTLLEEEVHGLIARFVGEGRDGGGAEVAVVVLGDKGEALVDIRGREPMKPASNMKVLTTAAALHWLGAGHEYETTLTARAPLVQGAIAGDVVVRGTGDPNLSGRFRGGDPAAIFRDWARKLREAGLRRIDGDLIADDTFFDDVRMPPSWDSRQEEAWYSAQVSALSLNDNCLDIRVSPGSRAGAAARVVLGPACSIVSLRQNVVTAASGSPRVIVHRKRGTNDISVTGNIGVKSAPWSGNVTVHDPALFFAATLEQVLEAEGIEVAGRARKLERATGAERDRGPTQGRVLVRHVSTLAEDLPIINKRSQNLHAEILLKVIGARVEGEGSLSGGDKAIRRYLRERDLPASGLAVGDGSGLSHENKVSALLLAAVLDERRRSTKDFPLFLASLPVAGEDGTLDDRFKSLPALRGKIHAKTGYIRGVSCLSGYVLRDSRVWSFSVLVNGLRGGAQGAKRLQERVGERVYDAMGR